MTKQVSKFKFFDARPIMKNILTALLILCAANVSAQQVILKQTVVYPPFSVKYSASDAIPDSLTCSTATTTAPGLMSPLHVGQINTASATLITQGEQLKQAQKTIDSLRVVVGTNQSGSGFAIDTIRLNTYNLSASDAGKHLVFPSSATINISGVPRGTQVSIGTDRKSLLTGNFISRAGLKYAQAGGRVVIIGEGSRVRVTGDLSN